MSTVLNTDQICKLFAIKQRIELVELVREADDERLRLMLRIIEADQRSLEDALSALRKA